MNTRNLRHRGFAVLTGIICSGCVSQYKVSVGFSPELRDYFNEIPTIEVDIAAVTDDEAGEVKQAGVEKYFSPGSGFRDSLKSQTCFFSLEDDARFVLPSRAPLWKAWLDKKPSSILVIASLPPDAAMNPQSDPRYMLIKMKKTVVLASAINILVEPQKIVHVSRLSAASTQKSKSTGRTEQWVEQRKRSTR